MRTYLVHSHTLEWPQYAIEKMFCLIQYNIVMFGFHLDSV